jgi:hypothetical protein
LAIPDFALEHELRTLAGQRVFGPALQDVLPKVRECLEKAAENRRKAEAATDPDVQRFYFKMEARWFGLAESYDNTRRTNKFLNIRPGAEADRRTSACASLAPNPRPRRGHPAATGKRRSGPRIMPSLRIRATIAPLRKRQPNPAPARPNGSAPPMGLSPLCSAPAGPAS